MYVTTVWCLALTAIHMIFPYLKCFLFFTVHTPYIASVSLLGEVVFLKKPVTSFGIGIISILQMKMLRHKYHIQSCWSQIKGENLSGPQLHGELHYM